MTQQELQTLTIYKVNMMPLTPCKQLNWDTGYGWVQQRATRFLDYMSLPMQDRHHALILQILTQYGHNIMEHFERRTTPWIFTR